MVLRRARRPAARPGHPGLDLDALRREGDERVDAVIRGLVGRNAVWSVNALLARVATPSDPLPAELPEEVRTLLEEGRRLPAWADAARIERAQSWSERHLIHIVTALFCASLPTSYAAARGAKVLFETQRMQRDIDRRVNETGRFVLDVLAPGGLSARGRGALAAQKVRLLHGAIRHHVRAKCEAPPDERGDRRSRWAPPDDSRPQAGEVPINQEDQLGTLFSFSLVVLDALERMGVSVSDQEREDYYHLWRIVGHLLGVRSDVAPTNVRDARALAARVAARQLAPSPEGRQLAATLIEAMERHMALPILRGAPRRLVLHLVGPKIGDVLGISAPPPSAELGWLGRAAGALRLGEHAPRALVGLSGLFGRQLLERMMSMKLKGTAPTFRLPAALGERWDLSST